MSTIKVTSYKNDSQVKNINRRTQVVKPVDKNGEITRNKNVIYIKAMVSEVGSEPGVSSGLFCKDKIKHTRINLTDEALFDLYLALNNHYKNGNHLY